MSLLNGLNPGDRVRITIKDPDSNEQDQLNGTVITASPTLNTLLVKPDNNLFGMVDNLLVQGTELLALERITTWSPS